MKRFLIGALMALVCGVAAAQAATPAPVTGTVKWTAPATGVDGNPAVVTSYNVYAGVTTTTCSASTALTKVGSTASGVTTFSEAGIVPGTTICVGVTAVNANATAGYASESAMSPLGSYSPTLPSATPNAPTNVTITIIITPTS